MKIILPGLTLLVAGALPFAAPAESPPAANTASAGTLGDEFLRQVLVQLERRDSVVARLRFQASFDDRKLAGTGGYWQQGHGESMRVRLELRLGGQTSLLQVSNGRFFWSDQTLPTGRTITRLDQRQLRGHALLADGRTDRDGLELGRALWFPIQPEVSARAGGLPALLSALSEHFTFAPPQAMRWTPSPPLSGLPDALPVYAIVGRWRPEAIEALLTTSGESGEPPDRVPHEVLLLVSQTESFPYHIEYRRRHDPAASKVVNGIMAPFQLSADPLVLVEYFDVAFDVPISIGQFDYSPGDANWEDRTAEQLNKLRGKPESPLARRKGRNNR